MSSYYSSYSDLMRIGQIDVKINELKTSINNIETSTLFEDDEEISVDVDFLGAVNISGGSSSFEVGQDTSTNNVYVFMDNDEIKLRAWDKIQLETAEVEISGSINVIDTSLTSILQNTQFGDESLIYIDICKNEILIQDCSDITISTNKLVFDSSNNKIILDNSNCDINVDISYHDSVFDFEDSSLNMINTKLFIDNSSQIVIIEKDASNNDISSNMITIETNHIRIDYSSNYIDISHGEVDFHLSGGFINVLGGISLEGFLTISGDISNCNEINAKVLNVSDECTLGKINISSNLNMNNNIIENADSIETINIDSDIVNSKTLVTTENFLCNVDTFQVSVTNDNLFIISSKPSLLRGINIGGIGSSAPTVLDNLGNIKLNGNITMNNTITTNETLKNMIGTNRYYINGNNYYHHDIYTNTNTTFSNVYSDVNIEYDVDDNEVISKSYENGINLIKNPGSTANITLDLSHSILENSLLDLKLSCNVNVSAPAIIQMYLKSSSSEIRCDTKFISVTGESIPLTFVEPTINTNSGMRNSIDITEDYEIIFRIKSTDGNVSNTIDITDVSIYINQTKL